MTLAESTRLTRAVRPISEEHARARESLARALSVRMRDQLVPFADVAALELAARMSAGLPVTAEAAQDVARRYLDLIVELARQVDAREATERDLVECKRRPR